LSGAQVEKYKEDPAAKWSQSGGKIPAAKAATHIKNCLNVRESVLYSERHNWLENKKVILSSKEKSNVSFFILYQENVLNELI